MRGCFIILLAVTQFFFLLFAVTGVGNVKDWHWSVVLIPLWIYLGIQVIVFTAALAELIDARRSYRNSLDTTEGPWEAFWRKRRARKHAKEQEKWGITK